MSLSDKFINTARNLLPTPFTIAILLTLVSFLLSILFFEGTLPEGEHSSLLYLAKSWYNGLWNKGLLAFAIQMMLILVLGHCLALSKPVTRLINLSVKWCNNTAKAALVIGASTILVALFNWGLGLIFGAIFARKFAEFARSKGIKINYGLIGAAGYSGLMVWHGGLSGSAPLKVAEDNHDFVEQLGVIAPAETLFSSMNITASLLLLLVVPFVFYWVGKKSKVEKVRLKELPIESEIVEPPKGFAEQLDRSKFFAILLGSLAIAFSVFLMMEHWQQLKFLNPNWINFSLLGLGLIFHSSIYNFLRGIGSAISGATGILIQFPLYFGILALLKSSGLIEQASTFFVSVSNDVTFPLFTFVSAGIVNIFVPSGGGQWVVQGPVIIEALKQFNVAPAKAIMALAYGDQLTNMLQPFWALPLLGITGLRAKEILPYTLIVMLVGIVVFTTCLLLF